MNIHNFANLTFRSPYLTPSRTLRIGDYGDVYQIHQGILSRYPELADACSSDSWGGSTTKLPDTCEEVGHTLIHYLYTGTYEALQPQINGDTATGVKMISQLYGIAVQYNITGLPLMLQDQIEATAKTLDIFDVVGIAQTAYRILSKENDWLTIFLKKEMKAALMIDTDFLTTSRFLELIGTVKLFDRILMRIVAEIYNEKIAIQARPLQDPIYTPINSNTSSLNDASDPQSVNELDLCQEATVPCDEPTTCEEAIDLCDVPARWEGAAVPCDELAPWEVVNAPYDEPALAKMVAVPCEELPPCEVTIAPCETTIFPCEELPPCQVTIAPYDEPTLGKEAVVPCDEPAMEETLSKVKKEKKGKKEKKETGKKPKSDKKARRIACEAEPVIEAESAIESEPLPLPELVPETGPKIGPEKSRDVLDQILLCLAGKKMTNKDKCEIIKIVLRS